MSTTIPTRPAAPHATEIARMQAQEPPAEHAPISPEYVLDYCAAKLREIDARLAGAMKNQKGSQAALKLLGEARSRLDAAKKGGIERSTYDAALRKLQDAKAATTDPALKQKIDALISKLHANLERAAPQKYYANVVRPDGTIGTEEKELPKTGASTVMSENDAGRLAEDIGGLATEMTSNAALDMLTLQQLAGERQQFLSMTTNLLSSLNQPAMACVNNIKG